MTLNDIITNSSIALGMSIFIGSWLGKTIKYKNFSLGLIAGTLLVSVIIGQITEYKIADDLHNMLFALFIFAVGLEAGATFFKSLNKQTLILLSVTLLTSIVGLLCVVAAADYFHFDKGLAAGLAAGALTQSSIIGAASSAIAKLHLAPSVIKSMQVNVAVGYSMTYIMGSFLPIVIITGLLPLLKKWDLRKDARRLAEEAVEDGVVLEAGEYQAVAQYSTRFIQLTEGSNLVSKRVADVFSNAKHPIMVDYIQRDGKALEFDANTVLLVGDTLAVTAKTELFTNMVNQLGTEVAAPKQATIVHEERRVIVKNPALLGQKIVSFDLKNLDNVFIKALRRESSVVAINQATELKKGDELILVGSVLNLNKATKLLGFKISPQPITDFTLFGLFLALGFLIGMISFKLFGTTIALGSGLGCLISGILLGWINTKKPQVGMVPAGAIKWLKDFGLAGFVGSIGLTAGEAALHTIMQQGATVFVVGLFVSVIPMLVAYLWMEYVLRVKSPIIITATLNGARSSNPGFASVLDAAENSTPVPYFTPAYTLAQITQTVLGVLVVAIVPIVLH